MDIPDKNPHEQGQEDPFLEENKKIAQKIKTLIGKYELAKQTKEIDGGKLAMFNRYDTDNNLVSAVELIEIMDLLKEGLFYLTKKIPPKFNLPIFVFCDFPEPVTTPYGVLPNHVVSEGKMYFLGNYYFFDETGNAAKYEEILGADQQDLMAGMGKMAPEVDFQIDPKDSRFIPLVAGDREKIEGILHQIETGEFKEV